MPAASNQSFVLQLIIGFSLSSEGDAELIRRVVRHEALLTVPKHVPSE
jgi:hypothetical protein